MSIPQASEFFVTGLSGTQLLSSERSLLTNSSLGGVILFKRNCESLEQIIELNKSIISANSEHPPLISVDQEGGRVARLRGIASDLPSMRSLEEQFDADPHLAFRLGALLGRELCSMGFTLNFAPVCDVHNFSDDHVIGDRAFSRSPQNAAHYTARFLKGMQGAGVAACAKHFPGHGATTVDSHYSLPEIPQLVLTKDSACLSPFQHAIAADVATIMTAHIVVKQLDNKPATMSHAILSDLLRTTLGYSRIIISDDLDMNAVANHYSLEEIIYHGMMASVDLFIIGNESDKTRAAIEILQNLIAKDPHIKAQAIASQKRMNDCRTRYIGKARVPDLSYAQSIVRCAPHRDLIARLSC